MRLSRLYLWVITVAVPLGLALVLNEWLGIVYYRETGQWLAAVSLALAYGLTGLGCAVAYEHGKAPGLMRSGMIVGAVALAAWMAVAFVPELQVTFSPYRACVWLTIWPCLMAISGMLLLLPMHDGWRWRVRAGTLITLTFMGVFIAGVFAFYPDAGGLYDDDWMWRRRYERAAIQVGLALAMLAGGAVATTVIAGLTGALTGRAAPSAHVPGVPYWLRCPRCGCEQNAMTGDHFCVACRLRTRVEFV